MNYIPINYNEPLFRPPSEANSVIFQVTIGCSWNRCAFCEMYTSKKFRVRKEEEVFEETKRVGELLPDTRKIFLADGNAMVLSSGKLLRILETIHRYFPKINRISAYALPKDLLSKTQEELKALHDAGLKLIYMGIESGDDELLGLVNKGETFKSTVEGLLKAKEAGIKSSVMILTGLGGQKYSRQHTIQSAKILNETQPEFASTLVLSFPYGTDHFKTRFQGEFIPMNTIDLLKELAVFIEHTDLKETIFRSDHASNHLALKGILGRDKGKFIEQLRSAIDNPNSAGLREEWMRGL